MTERITPPDPELVIDRDTLGDMEYDRAVEAALWEPPVVEPLVEPAPRTTLVTKSCPFCLDGRVILPGYQIALCGCCNGKGYFLTDDE